MSQIREAVLLASGARTSTQTVDLLALSQTDNVVREILFSRGIERLIEVTLDLTAFTTAASLTLSIETWDVAKGGYVPVLTSAAIAATGTTILRYGPESPNVANLAQNGIIPNQWRAVVTHGNANSHTYSLSVRLMED